MDGTAGITLLAPQRCKLLAVQVEINIADDHVCCARKHIVVLAALRDRVVCAWALGGGGCLKLRPSMLYHMPPSDVPALQYHIRHGVM